MRTHGGVARSAQAERRSEPRTLTLHWPWWVHPAWALLLLTGLMAVISLLLPSTTYAQWRVHKYLDSGFGALLVLGIATLFLGIMATGAMAARGGSVTLAFNARQLEYLRRSYRLLFVLTIVGYLLWMGSAIHQGVGLNDLRAVLNRQDAAISTLKQNSRPIGGVTTLTQFGPVAVAIGLLRRRLGVAGRSYRLLIMLALVRTLFYAERLALMEVLIPVVVLAALTVQKESRWRRLVRVAPLIVTPLTWLLFAASEYTRSWVYYQQYVREPFLEWVTVRMLGYYVTSFNNSALFSIAHAGSSAAPYFSVPLVWNAPLLGSLVGHQPEVHLVPADDWWTFVLRTQGNPEFNNIGSFLTTYSEFGPAFMVLFWLLVGLAIGAMFASLSKGSLPALLGYATLFVGILELSRFIYWTEGRAFPVLVALILIALTYPREESQPTAVL